MIALTAIAGTTISPDLFFWQASEEVEERNDDPQAPVDRPTSSPCVSTSGPGCSPGSVQCSPRCALRQERSERPGVTISSAEQPAEALQPLAETLGRALFAMGFIGLGLLAVPVPAASTASTEYAVSEALSWNEGLSRRMRGPRASTERSSAR